MILTLSLKRKRRRRKRGEEKKRRTRKEQEQEQEGNAKEIIKKQRDNICNKELHKGLEDEKENNEQDKQCTYNVTLGGICVMFTSPQLS